MAYTNNKKYYVLNIIDLGTRYGERVIAESRNAADMMYMVDSEWIYHHGAPKRFGADQVFCRPIFERFLKAHEIELMPRPSRSSYKNGKVERNDGVFKSVLLRLEKEKTDAPASVLIDRASFMTNMFHGNSVLSSFQLARGYAPYLLGIPKTFLTAEILDAHV